MPKQSSKHHKIMSIFKRAEDGSFLDEYSTPEIKYLADKEWVFTEKIDGTNIRIMFDGFNIKYGGRSDNAQIPVSLIHRFDELFKANNKIEKFIDLFMSDEQEEYDVTLYGEGFGAKIQKGGGNYISDDVDFVLFDVKIGKWWLERDSVENIANELGIQVVPVIGRGTLNDAIEMTKKGFNSKWGEFIAEGIVARPKVELFTRRGDRIITKVKYHDFH